MSRYSMRSLGEIFYQALNVHTVNDILMDVTNNNRIKSCLNHCTSQPSFKPTKTAE